MDYLQLIKSDPSSTSSDDDMTTLMILAMVNTAPLLGGNAVLFDMKEFPPALILDFCSESYETLLWPARTMSLVWYVIIALGWVAT